MRHPSGKKGEASNWTCNGAMDHDMISLRSMGCALDRLGALHLCSRPIESDNHDADAKPIIAKRGQARYVNASPKGAKCIHVAEVTVAMERAS